MFERLGQLAAQSARDLSRRQFLGNCGRAAMIVAAAAGGLLAWPADAEGGQKVCSPTFSLDQCRGQPVGAPCTSFNGKIGRCGSTERAIEPGVYSCNVCRSSGRDKDPRVR
jgi:hypothetical protein